MGWGVPWVLSKSPELLGSRACPPQKGSFLHKPVWAPEHTSPSSLQSKLVSLPRRYSAAHVLALRLCLTSPKLVPPRVSLAEKPTPSTPLATASTETQESFPRTLFLMLELTGSAVTSGSATPPPQPWPLSPGTQHQHLGNTNKEDAQVAPAFGGCCLVTGHGP